MTLDDATCLRLPAPMLRQAGRVFGRQVAPNLLALRLVRRSVGEGGSRSEGGKELGYGG